MVDSAVRWARPPWQGVAESIRGACASLPLRVIDGAFAAELGPLAPKHETRESDLIPRLGQRRARATVWLERIAWTDVPPLKLGEILERLREPLLAENPTSWEAIELELKRVGWQPNGYGPLVDSANFGTMPSLTNAGGISQELARLDNALHVGDVHGAVGYAKNLVEGSAKFAYPWVIGPLPKDPKFRPLVHDVGEQLAGQVPSAAPAEMSLFFSHLTESVQQLGPIRNRIDGTGGHGSPVWDPWLLDAHARLLAEVGVAWARFVLQCAQQGGAEDDPGTARE